MRKRISRFISILLSFSVMLAVFSVPASIPAFAATGDYYVQYGGTGDGRSIGSPARSVKTAIASMNADGLAAGDTANIYILSSSGVTGSSHTLTPWGISGDPEQTHTAQIVIQGYEGRQWLAYGANMNSNINLCGPTTFTNLNLFTTRTDHGYIRGYGNNITFGTNVKNYKLSGSSTQECHSPYVVMTKSTNSSSTNDVTATQTITFNSPMIAEGMLFITSENYDNRKHKEDANIVLNHADIGSSGSYKLIFGGTNENTSTHTFEKNLNIDIRNATKIGFQGNVKTAALDKSGSNQKVKVNGGLQIMTKPGVKFYNIGVADDISAYAAVTGLNNLTAEVWVLTVASSDRSKIDFTATAGTYSVAPGYTAMATNNSTGVTVESENGQLVLPAGDWVLSFTTGPRTMNYYVKNGGTGDGKTPETPAPSVSYVSNTMYEDELTVGDTANVYIMQRDDVPAANSGTWTGALKTTAYKSDSALEDAGTKAHTCKMVVQSYGDSKNYLSYGYTVGQNRSYSLLGPTEFKNIKLLDQRGGYGAIYCNGYDVVFDSDVVFYKNEDNNAVLAYAPNLVATKYTNSDDISARQTITYNAQARAAGKLYVSSDSYDGKSHLQDATIILNNEDIGLVNAFNIWFGGEHSNTVTHKFKKNLNISVDDAAKVNFRNSAGNQKIQVDGGLQIIANPTTLFNGTAGNAYAALTSLTSLVNTSVYALTVAPTDREKIDFTATAGTYSVAEGYIARAVDANSVVYTSENGVLTVPAGNYSLSFQTDAEDQYSDYIFNRGSGLQNTYSKLTTGDKVLNVVYYGGSVTQGYGGPGFDSSKCWRNLIKSWLDSNFPAATINHINKACGESGTFLGSYRLQRDVISQNPDLVFLEYSINDKYDNASYERAAYQYETIVRNIKKQLPTCDIVTILVTDEGEANNARAVNGGKLHRQAQAHEDMAVKYNIPTLHVGRALADLLPDNFTYEQWKSICGAYDTVHLVEGGNEVYYNVIKEYFNSELFGDKYNGTLASYTLPEVQSQQLLDGNITYIQPSQALVNRSEELGGTGVRYRYDENFTVKGYADLFNFYYGNDGEHMLCVEFNGTELIGLLHNYNDARNAASNRTYDISIDGGEFTTHNFYHMNPTTFVTGLEPGNHVAKIRVSVEDSDNWLWIGALYSRDESRRTIKGADYTPELIESNFTAEGGEIRDTDGSLRFVFTLSKSFLGEMANVIEYGAITLPTDTTEGKEMFLDTPIVKEWQWDSETKSNFTAKTTGATPIKVVCTNKLLEDESQLKYTLCLTGFTQEQYDDFYSVRGYVKYTNASGATRVVYTDDFETSLYKLAAETPAGERTSAENAIVAYVEGDRVTNYFATNTIKTYNSGYEGNEDTNPNHKIYTLQNGLVVRDVTVSGNANTEKTEIAFLSDPHFNYINEQDIFENNVNALASYRGRNWLRDNSHLSDIKKEMEFASMFKKIVMGGDAVDYLSKGSLLMTKRLFTDKSVNGSIKMTMGNHEYSELMQQDTSGLSNKYSLEQRYAMVQKYWANDVYFDYEIMKKNDGVTDNVMLIYMDNANNRYWASQIPKLESALNEARAKNVPVLIFQHVPLLTMNPNETSVYLWEGWQSFGNGYQNGNTRFATAEKNSGVVNMNTKTGYVGSADSDANTMAVCEMIRKNYDIIKGVFHGHEHSNMYTEIIGLNSDGTTATDGNGNPCVIPQHGAYGAHYNSVMKITIE